MKKILKNILIFSIFLNINCYKFELRNNIDNYCYNNFKSSIPGNELWRYNKIDVIPGPLNKTEVDYFFNNGYIILRDVIDKKLLKKIRDINNTCYNNLPQSEYEAINFNSWKNNKLWLDLAFNKKLVDSVAQLTPSVSHGHENLHILKDAYFNFKGDNNNSEKIGCDWHVDDIYFWPTSLKSDGPGINAWIALDEVTEDGGGLCIANCSHTKEFIDCRIAIGNGLKYPFAQTCFINKIHPDGRKRLEMRCIKPLMKPGDVILHTRFLFHRTSEFKKNSKAIHGNGIRRYTIRYVPSSSILLGVDKMDKNGKPIYFNGELIKDYHDSLRFPVVPRKYNTFKDYKLYI